jgi:hypothetical protein
MNDMVKEIRLFIDPMKPEVVFDQLNALEIKTVSMMKFVSVEQVLAAMAEIDKLRVVAAQQIEELNAKIDNKS